MLRALGINAPPGFRPYLHDVTISSIPLPVAPYVFLNGTTGYENLPKPPISRYDLLAAIRDPSCGSLLNCFNGSNGLEYQRRAIPGILRTQNLDNIMSLGYAPSLENQLTNAAFRTNTDDAGRPIENPREFPGARNLGISNNEPTVYGQQIQMTYDSNCFGPSGGSTNGCYKVEYRDGNTWASAGYISYIDPSTNQQKSSVKVQEEAIRMVKVKEQQESTATRPYIEVPYEDYGDEPVPPTPSYPRVPLPPSWPRRLQPSGVPTPPNWPTRRLQIIPMPVLDTRRIDPMNPDASYTYLQKWESEWHVSLLAAVKARRPEPITETLLMESGVYDRLPFYGISTTPEWIEYQRQKKMIEGALVL